SYKEDSTVRHRRWLVSGEIAHSQYKGHHDHQCAPRKQDPFERTPTHYTAYHRHCQCAIAPDQPSKGRTPSTTVELLKKQKAGNDWENGDEPFYIKSDILRWPEAQ